MANKKIFIVTSGEYSDYHIEGVFSTKKLAEEFAAKGSGNVEEYDLDARTKDQVREVFCVEIDLHTGEINREDSVERLCGDRYTEVNIYGYPSRSRIIAGSVVSRDHAIKIAVEGRQKWLREQQ
jgi:hypothetical protein